MVAGKGSKNDESGKPAGGTTGGMEGSEVWDLSEQKRKPQTGGTTGGNTTHIESKESVRENDKDKGLAAAYATAIGNVGVRIEPDLVFLDRDTSKPFSSEHTLVNLSQQRIIFRVKTTDPKSFVVRPVSGQVFAKGSSIIKITRLEKAPLKSDRFDVEILPLLLDYVPKERYPDAKVALSEDARNYSLFALNYRPIVRHIRFRAPAPWSKFVDRLSEPTAFRVDKNLEQLCQRAGLAVKDGCLPLNEAMILLLALEDVK